MLKIIANICSKLPALIQNTCISYIKRTSKNAKSKESIPINICCCLDVLWHLTFILRNVIFPSTKFLVYLGRNSII